MARDTYNLGKIRYFFSLKDKLSFYSVTLENYCLNLFLGSLEREMNRDFVFDFKFKEVECTNLFNLQNEFYEYPINEMKWAFIPKDVLFYCSKFLESDSVILASEVCSTWRNLIHNSITDLSLSWCSKNINQLLAQAVIKFQELQIVNLHRCKNLNDFSLSTLSSHCHGLLSISLSSASNISDKSIIILSKNCPLLEQIDLSGCIGLKEEGIKLLSKNCQKLRSVNCCGCVSAVTDATLQSFGNFCPLLQHLNLGWCEKISDFGITNLTLGCKNFTFLDLCGCVRVTDKSVECIANNCMHLERLGLHCCRNITDKSIFALIQNHEARFPNPKDRLNKITGKGLLSLNLSGCILLRSLPVQQLCDTVSTLHTCKERISLNLSGCISLVNVQCQCVKSAAMASSRTSSSGSGMIALEPRHRPL